MHSYFSKNSNPFQHYGYTISWPRWPAPSTRLAGAPPVRQRHGRRLPRLPAEQAVDDIIGTIFRGPCRRRLANMTRAPWWRTGQAAHRRKPPEVLPEARPELLRRPRSLPTTRWWLMIPTSTTLQSTSTPPGCRPPSRTTPTCWAARPVGSSAPRVPETGRLEVPAGAAQGCGCGHDPPEDRAEGHGPLPTTWWASSIHARMAN